MPFIKTKSLLKYLLSTKQNKIMHIFSLFLPIWFLNLHGSHIQTFLYKCISRRKFMLEKEKQDSHLTTSETGGLIKTVMRMTITF